MVAVQNLKGETIQLILSRKGGGMYLVNATLTKLLSTGNVRLRGMNFTMLENNMHYQKHLKIKRYLTQELKNIVLN
jgi:hypothetical protein